jgi:hypothetical protein
MNAITIKWLVTGAFALHGLGMLGAAGYLPFSMRDPHATFVGASWLLGAGAFAIAIGVLVWAVAGVGFLAGALGFVEGLAWWRPVALVGAAFTLAAIALWVGKMPWGVYVGGLLALGTIGYLVAA